MTLLPSELVSVQDETANSEVIRLTGVYKYYKPLRYQMSLRHEAGAVLRQVFGRYLERERPKPFCALQDINLSIRKGEAVAIIGRNGAGKTTLLRLLSGITQPTQGTVEVRGRFATLIGLSAGFNEDMPGRRNIYLNAGIFGVQPKQVKEIEQDIIDFADIGEFIDRPVKLYSSGMKARLGFSIAIHILPEIVFLDEVLSVGDAAFVEKCNERILRLREEQRTIVLVSHDRRWVRDLCTRAVWLHEGKILRDGNSDEVLDAYLAAF